jgi:hypothetical protein
MKWIDAGDIKYLVTAKRRYCDQIVLEGATLKAVAA